LVTNLTITRCATSEGTTCTLIVITADKKHKDTQWWVITVTGTASVTTRKVILFHAGMSKKKSGLYLNCAHISRNAMTNLPSSSKCSYKPNNDAVTHLKQEGELRIAEFCCAFVKSVLISHSGKIH
jgi:hypothetical protein